MDAAIDNEKYFPLLRRPCFLIENEVKYPNNRGVMHSTQSPYPSLSATAEVEVDEWPIYSDWKAYSLAHILAAAGLERVCIGSA